MPQGALPAPKTNVIGLTSTGSLLNITAATVVKAAPGTLVRLTVITPGSTAGTANDVLTTGAAAIGNQVFAIPNTAGVYSLNWPMLVGLVIVPGTGQVVSVAYS